MRLFQLLTSRKDSSYQIIISVAISYILKAICSICHKYILSDKSFEWNWRVIILSLSAAILAIITVIVTEIKCINRILLRINNKSIHDDIWQDIIDYKNGTTLRLTCSDTIYIGELVGHEEKGNDSWFVMKDFIVNGKNEEYDSKDMDCYSRIAINLKNVDRIELFYGKQNIDNFNNFKEIKKLKNILTSVKKAWIGK